MRDSRNYKTPICPLSSYPSQRRTHLSDSKWKGISCILSFQYRDLEHATDILYLNRFAFLSFFEV